MKKKVFTVIGVTLLISLFTLGLMILTPLDCEKNDIGYLNRLYEKNHELKLVDGWVEESEHDAYNCPYCHPYTYRIRARLHDWLE